MLYLLLRYLTEWLDRHGLYWLFGLLDQSLFRAMAAAALSFALVLLVGRPTIRRLVRLKIGDAGVSDAAALASHSASKANTPTMGGVLIAGAILVSTLLLADIAQFYVQVALVVLVCFTGLGAADDWLKLTAARRGHKSRQGLYAWEKLVFQIGLALLVGFFLNRHGQAEVPEGMARVLNLPMQRTYEPAPGGNFPPAPGLWYLPAWALVLLCVLFMTGMSNATNITDGMDGLASGIAGVVSLGLCVLALIAGSSKISHYLLVPYIPGAADLGVIAAAMGGACLGFLWWNCAPAAVFMGDTGSLCLGGLIAYIALVTRQEILAILMCGVFILEAASVMLQVGYFKATKGKRIFRCAPYHHHLHLLGWTEQQVVVRFWIISVLLVIIALTLVKVR